MKKEFYKLTAGARNFLLTIASRPALEPIQPPI